MTRVRALGAAVAALTLVTAVGAAQVPQGVDTFDTRRGESFAIPTTTRR